MYILCIDTGTTTCSVALGNGSKLVGIKEVADSHAHSSQLTVLIDELLKETNLSIKSIDAVAINKGPGSYTGLRIGTSAAKGICYALGKPLISVGSLEAMVQGVEPYLNQLQIDKDTIFCPMIDARRMEVYTALYDHNLNPIAPVEAKIIDENSFRQNLDNGKVVFFGNGAPKCKSAILHKNAIFIDNFEPSAAHMLPLAQKALNDGKIENTAYFEPFYLKDFVAIRGKNKVLSGL